MRPGEHALYQCADCSCTFAVVLTGLTREFQEAAVECCPFCGSTEEISPAAPPATQSPYRARPLTIVGTRRGLPEVLDVTFDRAEAEISLADAQARADLSNVHLEEGDECYPPPGDNPQCQCQANPMAPMFCPFGHLTECHYPLTCEDAECSHLARYL